LSLGVAALVLIGVGVGAGVALQSYLATRTTLADLADAAVEQHQKLVRDLLPPDIKDVSPRAAEEWFRKRLAFNVSLPDLKTERLQFLGGRISHLRDVEVAALEYQVDANNVSLFIIPEEAYRRLRLNDKPRFKVVSHRGYDVVIWRSQGAGYTLVSEIGDRACLVCHAPDEKLEPLPRPSAHL
jgi:anti-sigma factor RsiW